MPTLAIDFGTSNTAAAVLGADGRPRIVPLEDGQDTLPTAVFLDFSKRRPVYGRAAARAMMDGEDGRFLRALKSILGTPLAREKRQFLNEKMTLIDIIARFLAEIRKRAETATGQSYETALSGRPVHFHSADETRDAQALVDLTEAYLRAGFSSVDFLPEPEAAALTAPGTGRMLIVDIGGGTSDFTLCDRQGDRTEVLASRGIRLGGTDADRMLSLSHAMPLLGYGSDIGDEFGGNFRTAPRALFQDLASWEKIAFLYDPALLRDVRRWVRVAREPRLFERLATVLDMHLGHDVAYAVEAGKIATNETASARIALDVVERGLGVALSAAEVRSELAGFADQIGTEALHTLADAGCRPSEVAQIVFVGGSSLLTPVRDAMSSVLPGTPQVDAEVFTAVVHGLARATA